MAVLLLEILQVAVLENTMVRKLMLPRALHALA